MPLLLMMGHSSSLTKLKREAMDYLERALFGEIETTNTTIISQNEPFARDITTLYHYGLMLEERIERLEDKFPNDDGFTSERVPS